MVTAAVAQIVSTTSHVHTYGEPEKLVFLAFIIRKSQKLVFLFKLDT